MKWKLLSVLLFLCTFTFTQNIPTKGNLGVAVAPAPTNEHGGIHALAEIEPNSTAEDLGMQVKDILLELNGIKLDSNQKVGEAIGKFVAGNKVTALVLRDGKKVELKGTIMAAAPFKKPNHEVELLEVPFRKGYVRAYLTHPNSEGPFPTIYFIQGYACQTINDHPQSPTLQLTNALVDMGYAVFRMEKPGIGEFIDLDPCKEYSFDDEVENFTNGLQVLNQQKHVDKDRIYVFGHSLGGNVAPLVGTDPSIAGVMVYGTMVKPWSNYLVDMALYSHTYSQDANTVISKIPLLKSAMYKLYDQNIPHTELNDDEKELLKSWQGYSEDGYLFTRTVEFWKNLNSYNWLEEWSKVKVPVLSIHGESDAHAISSLDMELIAHSINQKNPNQAQFTLLKETNHAFAKVPSRIKELEYINSGMATQIAFTQFNQELPQLVDSWIQSLSSKDGGNPTTSFSIISRDIKPNPEMSSMDVITEDFNGDGHKDIVIASEFGPNYMLLYENGTWKEKKALPQIKEYQLPFQGEDSEGIATADFDKDGDLDLFFVSEDSENHELLLNDGKGQFSFAQSQIPKKGQANAVLIHDFNNDGWQDILIGIRGQNELYINQKGKGFKWNENIFPENDDHTQDLVLVDIDNDDDLDIIEGIEKGGNNLYLNQKGKFVEASDQLPLSEDIETRKIIPNDFDQDGDMDLFFCNVGWNPQKNPQNQLLQNNGKGKFKNISDQLPDDRSTTLDAVFTDVNNDGKLDVITTNFINDKKVKVFIAGKKGEKLFSEESDELFPSIHFMGGISLSSIKMEGKEYLYFGNFKSKDILLLKN